MKVTNIPVRVTVPLEDGTRSVLPVEYSETTNPLIGAIAVPERYFVKFGLEEAYNGCSL